ncbi:CAP domain-containing protein [Bacillus sp. B1-b2]|uniref:CAP domain-containing protein n=1 Tax=Bacillus sp. B1-b2 TaxID=2653201 RepID=UPI0012615751|nr:CAP domain-containing protein [Bacillus sp. B1-b2]KAB7671165.1 serine protease [Bacillus sp. B1-b2]
MRTLLRWLILIVIIYGIWNFVSDKSNSLSLSTEGNELHDSVNEDSISNVLQFISNEIGKLKSLILQTEEILPDWNVEEDTKLSESIEKPDLITPDKQTFSIYNISIGESKQKVEELIGESKRETINEYGISWSTYHQDYQNFIMVGYDSSNTVVALYTNQDLISSKDGIKLGSDKETVLDSLGDPLTELQKGFVFYKMPDDRDYEMFLMDDSYVTIFFDKHKNNTVTAMQIISTELEDNRDDFYVSGDEQLKIGFEYQLFDLTNASRVNNQLHPLGWDDAVKETARDHSLDMATNNYFDHTNLDGESPFDRMLNDGIRYSIAGENLAYGQNSSIFAHEGLMNSLGHRENILQKDFTLLGVGVAFNEKSQPYYTENFLTK